MGTRKLILSKDELSDIQSALYLKIEGLEKELKETKLSEKVRDIVSDRVVCLNKLLLYINEELKILGD